MTDYANRRAPVVEIGFMPEKLAARQDCTPSGTKKQIAPRPRLTTWDNLIPQFRRAILRGAMAYEVSQWYVRGLEEPNIDFWNRRTEDRRPILNFMTTSKHRSRSPVRHPALARNGGPATARCRLGGTTFPSHFSAEMFPVDLCYPATDPPMDTSNTSCTAGENIP
jgi:hypothetical protein